MKRVALLRGINVGGHRRVPMADLREVLTGCGLDGVSTYIQSGNVVFGGGPSGRRDAEALIGDAINERFGFDVPVIVRDASSLPVVLARSIELYPPARDDGAHDKRVHIGFLSTTATAAAIAAIDPERSPGDVAVVDGEHVHLSYGVGVGTSKLTGEYVERTLGVAVTMRNLATVRKLIALTS